MVQGPCDVIALCLSLIGLIGVATVTALPMWRVTAFIGENIIVMETRWEGLWMNCYRQANIRMQCKVYDSLLYLPPDLQAARGLTCCSLALCGFGIIVSLFGLRCMSCLSDQPRNKSIILMITGIIEILASFCIVIPVSWTAHTIIRDFYNPLLLDAQRRELGEALYIGWVTSAFLLASGVIFLCRRVDSNEQPFYARPPRNKQVLNHFQAFNSLRRQPLLQNNSFSTPQHSSAAFSFAVTPSSGQYSQHNVQPVVNGSLVYSPNMIPPQRVNYHGQNVMQSQILASNAQYPVSDPRDSFNTGSAFHPVQQNPLYVGYNYSRVQSGSSNSSTGLRI
uniref:claudin-17 n=1 Tax=Danio rerio TaxID=7955 RepID=UPI0000F200C4